MLCVAGSLERNQLNVPSKLRCENGWGTVSKATGVSFFASGPFPTCYQMSQSSTAEASKSSSLGAATGAANVRKFNTAARAARFQPKLPGQMERHTSCFVLDLVKETISSVFSKLLFSFSISYQADLFPSTATSADGSASNSHLTFWGFSKVCIKFTRELDGNIQ